jgi:4'-phosphopantetheinyl transferase
VAPSSLRFTKNEFGKPNVIWPVKRLDEWRPPSLCFNLTHTQSLLMCAVTQKAEVGIDVEERERKFTRDLMALARRQLSPEEADWLSQFTDPYEQQCQFMQLWTLKVDTN